MIIFAPVSAKFKVGKNACIVFVRHVYFARRSTPIVFCFSYIDIWGEGASES